MAIEDPQEVWSDYYQRKKAERMAEATHLWRLMEESGVVAETELLLDFVHFGPVQADVESLAAQLSEDYEMEVVRGQSVQAEAESIAAQLSEKYEMEVVRGQAFNYWFAKGTTRPYVITSTGEQLVSWVEFMSDVAQSYGCVFSTWSVEAPSLGTRFDSEQLDGGA